MASECRGCGTALGGNRVVLDGDTIWCEPCWRYEDLRRRHGRLTTLLAERNAEVERLRAALDAVLMEVDKVDCDEIVALDALINAEDIVKTALAARAGGEG